MVSVRVNDFIGAIAGCRRVPTGPTSVQLYQTNQDHERYVLVNLLHTYYLLTLC